MEIRQVLRGGTTGFVPTRPSKPDRPAGTVRPSTDRVELSRQWIRNMEDQQAQSESALRGAGKQDGILDYMETEEDELDALSEHLDSQMKCMKIAANIMKGKKVPPQDEQYLMEHDPEGYKLAISMRSLVKEDDEECESVLKDEDKSSGETSEAEAPAPAESGEAAPSGGEEAPPSSGE